MSRFALFLLVLFTVIVTSVRPASAQITPTPPPGSIPLVLFADPTRPAKCGVNPSQLSPGTGYYCTTNGTNAQAVGQGCFPGGQNPATWVYAGYGCTAGGTNYVYNKSLFNIPAGCTSGNLNPDGSCAAASSCPANSTLSGGSCTCSAGFTQSGNTCVSSCTAGEVKTGYMPKTGNPANACFGACQASVISASNQYMVAGNQVIAGQWELTGSVCSGGTATTDGTASAAPPGQCAGTVNGVTVFLPCTTATPGQSVTGSTSTTTKADGTSVIQNTTNTTNNYGGSTSTTTTTTTTTTPPGGSPQTETTQEKKNEETDKFCDENPQSPFCKQSTFGGTCGAFTCDGDAVTCAIAKDQHQRNCVLFDTATPLSQLGDAVASGADPIAGTLPSAAAPSVVNIPSTFDQTDLMGGSCISDMPFTVAGQSLSIPFSSLCPYFNVMGLMLVAFSLVGGIRIALGGIA